MRKYLHCNTLVLFYFNYCYVHENTDLFVLFSCVSKTFNFQVQSLLIKLLCSSRVFFKNAYIISLELTLAPWRKFNSGDLSER